MSEQVSKSKDSKKLELTKKPGSNKTIKNNSDNKSSEKLNNLKSSETNKKQEELGPFGQFICYIIFFGLLYLAIFKAIPFAIGKTGEFIGFTGNHVGRFIGGIGNGIGDIFDGDKKACNKLVNEIDKISSLNDFNSKTNNKEIYSKCESKNIDISKVKELGEKLEKEKSEKEERIKKEQEEKELAKKKAKEEAQKKIDDCKNSGGDWLEYSNKCYTKAEKLAAREESRKSCINRPNYTWDGESCIGKVWYWQGNDRQLNSDSRVSSNESKIVNEVFDAIERKSKKAYILDSGDGKPWAIAIKMSGDSLSEYTVVFYVQGGGSTYKAIVKNGVVLN